MKTDFKATSRDDCGDPRPYKPATGVVPFASSFKSLMLISAHSEEWNTYLERVEHDFYHTAQYHQVQEQGECGSAYLALYGKRDKFVAWPYLLHELPEGTAITGRHCRDVTSAYGYSGPLTFNCANDLEFLTDAWTALLDLWRSQAVVSVFTRFHPLLANYDWLRQVNLVHEGNPPGPGIEQVGQTVAVDLSRSEAETWMKYKRHVRQAVRRCEDLNFITTFDSEWTHCDDFLRLYYNTMDRNGAAPFYYFDLDYFKRLKQKTGPHSTLAITSLDGVAAAAALIFEYGGIANLHLLGNDTTFFPQASPTKLLIHNSQQWLRERGNRHFHLGGGRASRIDDTLFRFKSLFSRDYFPFYVGRWIIDRPAYDALSNARLQQVSQLQNVQPDEGFFPAYRTRLFNYHSR